MKELIDRIAVRPKFRTFNCDGCGTLNRVHALQMYTTCPGCRAHQKCRGFGEIGSELEDVLDAVLQWAGVTRDEVRARHEALERAS